MRISAEALYGAQTQRAVENFTISELRMPGSFIHALGLIKSAAARVNADLGLLDTGVAEPICVAANEIASGRYDEQFPVDVFQTGSGTSTNMNANEVIAHLASIRSGMAVHPNDHVNLGQSSNDVIPAAIHVSAYLALHNDLLPALKRLCATLAGRAAGLSDIVKTGRTHLMDALPLRLDQEMGACCTQIKKSIQRITSGMQHLRQLPLGGTAVGTGVTTPLAGLGEITLPVLQPDSSIMPGKVNPVIPEAVAMVCAQVIGNDTAITVAGQSGNFQLNAMLPLVAHNLLQSITLLAGVF